jgi:hypothetical protein
LVPHYRPTNGEHQDLDAIVRRRDAVLAVEHWQVAGAAASARGLWGGSSACLGFRSDFSARIFDRFAQLGRGGDAACVDRDACLERRLRRRAQRER